MKAKDYLKERDIPNEVITIQRDGWIEGHTLAFLLEDYAATKAVTDVKIKEIIKIFGEMVGKAIGQALLGQAAQYKKTVDEFKTAITELLNDKQ